MNSALGFCIRNTLYPMYAALEFHAAEHAFALYLEHYFVEPANLCGVGVHDLDFPALVGRVSGVGAVEIRGKYTCFGSTGTGANLHDYVAFVVRVFGEQR